MEKSKKMYMIGNSHIDPVWLWNWQEGFQEIKATFRSALDRMKEFDDFIFTCSAASYYEWVEQNDPEMFKEICARVAEGRWVLAGGWWIQPDCNAGCGESFVRQGLYGQRYFLEKFGKTATFGYNVDSFGHNGMLPQILKKSGMDGYVFMRPGRHEKHLEGETFIWGSADGSEVTAYRIPFEYCSWPDQLSGHVERCANLMKQDGDRMMSFYGVGNHGGAPTIRNIESLHELNRREDLPELLLSSPDRYFADVRSSGKTLPVINGELFHHSSGCYSAEMRIKSANRKTEAKLLEAEKLSVLSSDLFGLPYPREELTKAWKAVLFNQFHDIMAGTCIKSACEDALQEFSYAGYIADHATNAALQKLTWQIDIPMENGMRPLVVFNPNAFASRQAVEVEMVTPKDHTVLLDWENRQIPYQLIQSEASCNGRSRMVFVADLPALGYGVYRLAIREDMGNTQPEKDDRLTAENESLSLRISSENGFIESLINKADGTEFFRFPGAVPTVIRDESDTWSHGVVNFHDVKGEFRLEKVFCLEDGSVRKVIRAVYAYGNSRLWQDFTVYQQLNYVAVKVRVDWHEQLSMLKLRFPLQLNYLRASYEIPYGVSQREPNGQEFPVQNFMDFEGTNPGMETKIAGLSIITDTRCACSTQNKDACITILRSPVFAHHEPYERREDLEYEYIDNGVTEFTYYLYPHAYSWENSDTVRLSRSILHKPIALFETYHKGTLPQTRSFADVDGGHALLSAMKQAEDGSGDLILRLYETAGLGGTARVNLGFRSTEAELTFSPWEIKTIRVTADGQWRETDMLER